MVIALLFILHFSSYIFAGEPYGRVARSQRSSTLLNVRTALSNRLTPKQREILIPCLTIATRTACGLLFGYVVRTYNNRDITDNANIQGYDCYVDLGNTCVDTCNYLNNTCYLP